MTAREFFFHQNVPILWYGNPYLLFPRKPVYVHPVVFTFIDARVSQFIFNVYWQQFYLASSWMEFYATRPMPAGKSPNKGDYRYIWRIACHNNTMAPLLGDYFLCYRRYPPVGSYVHLRARVLFPSAGSTSDWSYYSVKCI
jgi:hypothetical protein